jgi:hypothetical protein
MLMDAAFAAFSEEPETKTQSEESTARKSRQSELIIQADGPWETVACCSSIKIA